MSSLNLRGLGAARTLVLQNGRRHVAGLSGVATVDISTIPVALIENVEILTGGASSIYGADAVTGVVNFILKDDFEGVDARAQASISDEGDAETYFAALAAGTNFANDRGNIYGAVEYNRTTPIVGFDRPGFAGSTRFQLIDATPELAEAAGAPPGTAQVLGNDIRFPFSSAAGAIDAFGTSLPTLFFDSGTGALRDFDFGVPTANAFEAIGGDGILLTTDRDSIIPEIDRITGNVGAKFQLHPLLTVFAEGKVSYNESNSLGGVNGFNDFIEVRLDNAFIPAPLRAALDGEISGGVDPADIDLRITRDTVDATTTPIANSERLTYRGVIGFEGEFENGWTYETSFNYGRTESDFTNLRTRIEDRFFAASDAIALDAAQVAAFNTSGGAAQVLRGGSLTSITGGGAQAGDIICRSEFEADTGAPLSTPPRGTFPGGAPDGFVSFNPGDGTCVPTGLFGEEAINADAAAFAFIPTQSNTTIEQFVVNAFLVGDSSQFFELPAGPVEFVIGGEYRREESDFVAAPEGLSALTLNPTLDPALDDGVTFAAAAGAAAVDESGSFDVTDFFAEVSVPLIKNYAPFHDVRLDGSIRHANYNTSGADITWGLGLNWEIVPGFRVRGSYSEATRAPNITELFAGQGPAFLGAAADPCNPANINNGPASGIRIENCNTLVGPNFVSTNTAFVAGVTGGNPNLEPESSVTYTFGTVLQPSYVPGLTIVVDYYDTEIEDAIATLTAFTIAENCVDALDLDNAFCAAIDRDPVTGSIIGFRSGQQNIAALETTGNDFNVNYQLDLETLFGTDIGALSLNAQANHLLDFTIFEDQFDPGLVDPETGEAGLPRWNVNANATWTYQNVGLTWQTRFQTAQLLDELENFQNNPLISFPLRTGNAFVHDLSVNYRFEAFGKEQQLFGGINNVFDRDPFPTFQTLPVSAVGRTFFIGVNSRF